MKSIEKLRELAADINSTEIIDHISVYPRCELRGDWLDSWHKAFDAACGEIEREIAERYMELPVDADGVPIHMGDSLVARERTASYRGTVVGIEIGNAENLVGLDGYEGYRRYSFNQCRHVRPRTIEDVLEEFAHEWNDTHHDDMPALKARYADELRSMGVDNG